MKQQKLASIQFYPHPKCQGSWPPPTSWCRTRICCDLPRTSPRHRYQPALIGRAPSSAEHDGKGFQFSAISGNSSLKWSTLFYACWLPTCTCWCWPCSWGLPSVLWLWRGVVWMLTDLESRLHGEGHVRWPLFPHMVGVVLVGVGHANGVWFQHLGCGVVCTVLMYSMPQNSKFPKILPGALSPTQTTFYEYILFHQIFILSQIQSHFYIHTSYFLHF